MATPTVQNYAVVVVVGVTMDTGELSLAAVSTTTLTEGIKFLYGQAAELLKRKRERADQKAEELPPLTMEGPPGLLDGSLDLRSADESRIDDHAQELTRLRRRLIDYVDGVVAISPHDRELLLSVDALRSLLELACGQYITFAGEKRPTTGTAFNKQDFAAAGQPRRVVTASGAGAIAIGGNNIGTAETHVSEN